MHSPRGEQLVFKRDTGSLKNMPYINVGDVVEAFAHANIKAGHDIEAIQETPIETVRMKMKDFSRREVKGAISLVRPKYCLATCLTLYSSN